MQHISNFRKARSFMNYSLCCFGVFGENFFVKFLAFISRNR
ncbi:hypothetical protein T11_229 [Trichinella zimbabwensis]|uniref:Uncharacterized protein n=1 Tax=Trichinella zimbabwensis TaxID=268475 RepID=A0A0V1G988_9BILA|nr:hypothetical protein T11_229 [Trichinella zimbabwensis]